VDDQGAVLRASSLDRVVLVAGSETVVNTRWLPDDARRDNLHLLVEALSVAGAPAFRLPRADGRSPRPVALVVPERHRAAVAAALSRAAERGGLHVVGVTASGRAGQARLADDADELWRDDPSVVRVYRRSGNLERTLFYGADLGCELHFWQEVGNHLVGSPTGVTTEVPLAWLSERVTTDLDGVPVPELPALLGLTLMEEVRFPIDAVYTWVDGSDPAWLTARQARRAASRLQIHLEADNDARYRSRDELKYSLRSLDYHAPWLRRVFVVTAGQAPRWLVDAHPDLVVVDHRDIFQQPGDLPTFNSHAIESQVHRIEGLSEHFLYLNDDFFLGRSLTPAAFFLPGGMPKAFFSSTTVGFPEGAALPHIAAALNNRRLVRRDFDRTLTRSLLHAPYALRRSVLQELAQRYPEELAATSGHPFRDPDDLSVTSSLFQHYGMATGQVAQGDLRVSYIGLGGQDVGRRLSRVLSDRSFDAFSIGDFHESALTPEEIDDMVRSFLEAYFPFPSRFER